MSIAIEIKSFVNFLHRTKETAIKNTPNYIEKMPPSSPKITYYTSHGIYGDTHCQRWTNDTNNRKNGHPALEISSRPSHHVLRKFRLCPRAAAISGLNKNH